MTPVPEALEPGAPGLAVAADDPDVVSLDEAPSWPVTRLAAWSLTVLLAVSVVIPLTLVPIRGAEWAALALPVMVATLGGRALFEALSLAGRPGRLLRHLLAAIPASLLATIVMAGAAAIVAGRYNPVAGIVSGVLATVTMTIAGVARDLEVRVRLSLRRVYFVGSRESGVDLARELARRHDATLVGTHTSGKPFDHEQLVAAARAARATVVVLDHGAMSDPSLVEVAARLNLAGLKIRDLVTYYESEFKKVPLAELSPTWFLFDIAAIHQRWLYRVLRRAFDVAVAAATLTLALPALLLAMIAIRLTSPGPALYRQRRVGRAGAAFTLLKLRTMAEPHDLDAPAAWASTERHRVTSVGRFLRRFRLDELPQLVNVLRGELAVVGPRPEQVPIVEQLDRQLPHYSARHCVRPGITGWAQVNLGYAGSVGGATAKLQLDLYYIKHHSLRLDALIVWLTLKAVIAGRG